VLVKVLLEMGSKFLALACLRKNEGSGNLSPRSHYPSMPRYPKGVTEEEGSSNVLLKALFSVTGMTCSACAASVEKAVKRLPGIRQAVVDVLNNRAQVLFYPSFVNVRNSYSSSSSSIHHCACLALAVFETLAYYTFRCQILLSEVDSI